MYLGPANKMNMMMSELDYRWKDEKGRRVVREKKGEERGKREERGE